MVAQLLLGMVATIVSLTFSPCDSRGACGFRSGRAGLVQIVVLAAWLGPWAIGFLGCGAYLGTRALWRARPRRIVEPIVEDLRTVERKRD